MEPYRCVRELGRGMAGVVHEALAPDGRRVVIKALRPHVVRQDGLVERFRREALMMAEIRHPNVMPVLDVQAEASPPFFVMPWVDGRTLAALLAEGSSIPIGRALEVLRGVAAALVEIHRHGLVHRDLKPDNVLLAVGGGVVLFDFGLAKRTSATEGGADLTKEGQILGTPAYMAPEQIRSGAIDGRTDVYALGVLAAELLSGTNPFCSDDVVETCRRQLVVRPDRLDQTHPSRVGRALGLLVDAMLAKQRDQRPVAREVLASLDRELAALKRSRACATQPSAKSPAPPAPKPGAAAPRSAAHRKPVEPPRGPASAGFRKPAGPTPAAGVVRVVRVDVTAACERARAQLPPGDAS